MAPEVLGTSGGADAPAVIALRAPLENLNSRKRSRMDRSQLTEKPLNSNQDRSSWFVCPEVPRTPGGAYAPAVVALRAPIRNFVVPSLISNLRPLIKGVKEDREDPVPLQLTVEHQDGPVCRRCAGFERPGSSPWFGSCFCVAAWADLYRQHQLQVR